MKLDDLRYGMRVSVKLYRADFGWTWYLGTVIDPVVDPPCVELDSGRQVFPRAGRIKPLR